MIEKWNVIESSEPYVVIDGVKIVDIIAAHYERMDPSPAKVVDERAIAIEALLKPYYRPDEWNFYQRTRACDGYAFVPRNDTPVENTEIEDYKRMYVSEHHKGNPRAQTVFDFPEEEIVDNPVDYMDTAPDGSGRNSKEIAYNIGMVYNFNMRKGKRRLSSLDKILAAYFKVTVRTVWKDSKFADACDKIARANDVDVMDVVNRPRPMSKIVKHAENIPEEPWPWVLKPISTMTWVVPWKTFEGERGYRAKEQALRI